MEGGVGSLEIRVRMGWYEERAKCMGWFREGQKERLESH